MNLKFDDILYKRIYSIKPSIHKSYQTVDSVCNYTFNYKCDQSELLLNDPSNMSITIDPLIEGVTDCVYSFEEYIYKYSNKTVVFNVITNTIDVLNQLKAFMSMFSDELGATLCELNGC